MRLIAIEEHFNLPEIETAPEQGGRINPAGDLLYDLDDGRLASMDAAGIDVQVLSSSTTSVQYFEPARSVELARKANDHLAAAIARHPDRFYGFATLPTPDPAAAVVELERVVRDYHFKGAMPTRPGQFSTPTTVTSSRRSHSPSRRPDGDGTSTPACIPSDSSCRVCSTGSRVCI